MGATFVKRHSSCLVVGNPSSTKCAIPPLCNACNQLGVVPCPARSKASNAVNTGSCSRGVRTVFASTIMSNVRSLRRVPISIRLRNPVVAALLQFKGEALIARANDSAIVQNMHAIRNDIIEETLVMSNEKLRVVLSFQAIHPLRHDPQGIDIQA